MLICNNTIFPHLTHFMNSIFFHLMEFSY